jgi:hypothetical protein
LTTVIPLNIDPIAHPKFGGVPLEAYIKDLHKAAWGNSFPVLPNLPLTHKTLFSLSIVYHKAQELSTEYCVIPTPHNI